MDSNTALNGVERLFTAVRLPAVRDRESRVNELGLNKRAM